MYKHLWIFFRLINGIFENYLTQKADGNMLGIVEAGEWFCFTDILHTQIQTVQNYSVYPYLPYGFVAWHLLFAGISWPKITFPTQSFEVNRFNKVNNKGKKSNTTPTLFEKNAIQC